MNLKLLFFCSLFLLSSCGSFEEEKKRLMNNPEKKDLVNSFEIEQTQAEKYKEKDAAEIKKDNVVIVKTDESNLKKEKKQKNKKEKIEVVGPPSPTKKELLRRAKEALLEIPPVVVPPETVSTSPYPDDFPQLFKDYDTVSKPIWEKFKPIFYQGEQSIIAISYLGVTAGYITVTAKDVVKMGDSLAFHYFARFKSKEAYSYFYWLDDTLETFIDKEKYLPIKYSLIQREKKQNVDDLQLFDHKKLKVLTWYKRVKVGADKNEHLEKYIPSYLQDSFSALQFVRGLPLKKGDKYDFPVSTRGDTWLLKTEVVGEEVISVNGQDLLAFRLKAETHFPGVLQKSGDINFWFANDEGKRLLKFQAKVKLGSIYGELVEYKPGILLK